MEAKHSMPYIYGVGVLPGTGAGALALGLQTQP